MKPFSLGPVKTSCDAAHVPSFAERMRRLHNMGVSVTDTMPDTSTAIEIVIENSCSKRPTIPPMKITG
jgi:hypothetical protein